jgi:hypothetical protein
VKTSTTSRLFVLLAALFVYGVSGCRNIDDNPSDSDARAAEIAMMKESERTRGTGSGSTFFKRPQYDICPDTGLPVVGHIDGKRCVTVLSGVNAPLYRVTDYKRNVLARKISEKDARQRFPEMSEHIDYFWKEYVPKLR